MQINTKKVPGRREVRYESLDELLADAKRFSGNDIKTLGNWSQGQIFEHIARSMDSSIDGAGFSFPAPLQWLMSLFMKKKFLTKTLPPGFKTTAQFDPEKTSAEEGLASLEKAIERQKNVSERAPHPGFGNIGKEGWDDFNLRHSEMHMSFLIPDAEV